MEIEAEKIVYESVMRPHRPATCWYLKEKYDVETIQPVDMFPHTQHVEKCGFIKNQEIRGKNQDIYESGRSA